MIYQFDNDFGFSIPHISICDFNLMDCRDNDAILQHAGKKKSARLDNHISNVFGIESRYWCKDDQSAIDLARSAVARLLEARPSICEEAEFFIYAGISNPLPATTISTLLCQEYGFTNASCWDIKSGCSTGVLALLQALSQIRSGAKSGVIVAAENLSRFADPAMLQISMTIGDGACALYVTNDREWKVRSAIHGTDATGSSFMRVLTEFPQKHDSPQPFYVFNDKPEAIKSLQNHWINSLGTILQLANVKGENIKHYIAHQIDTEKNRLIAHAHNINDANIALNFSHYGNMGCPTIFINLHEWIKQGHMFNTADLMVLQAVGGGISWAGLCLEYIKE